MSQLVTTSVWKKITSAAKSATKPSFAAVAYFGSKGDKLLPLRSGSKLVVDASLGAVSTGITDPKALRRLHNDGVKVFSMPLIPSVLLVHLTHLPILRIGWSRQTSQSSIPKR
jgi:hypothetical protein